MNWQEIVFLIISTILLSYAIILMAVYVFIGLFSIGELKKYLQKNFEIDTLNLAEQNYFSLDHRRLKERNRVIYMWRILAVAFTKLVPWRVACFLWDDRFKTTK